ALELGDLLRQALRNRIATAPDPDQHQVVHALVALHDLVGDARDDPAQAVGLDDFRLLLERHGPLDSMDSYATVNPGAARFGARRGESLRSPGPQNLTGGRAGTQALSRGPNGVRGRPAERAKNT